MYCNDFAEYVLSLEEEGCFYKGTLKEIFSAEIEDLRKKQL